MVIAADPEAEGHWLGHLVSGRAIPSCQPRDATVKFVVSCCVVSKQVELSTILASVESTGSWLHAGSCPVFLR